jgi:hypothetical protein
MISQNFLRQLAFGYDYDQIILIARRRKAPHAVKRKDDVMVFDKDTFKRPTTNKIGEMIQRRVSSWPDDDMLTVING